MFRPTETDEILEKSYQFLLQAYGYPRGDSEEIEKSLKTMDPKSPEYEKTQQTLIYLSRLEQFRKAINKQRFVRIQKEDLEQELNVLRRGGGDDGTREMELLLVIDKLNDEIDQLKSNTIPLEPKYRKQRTHKEFELLAEIDDLRDQLMTQQMELERYREIARPKASAQSLTLKRDTLRQELEQLEQKVQLFSKVLTYQTGVIDSIRILENTQKMSTGASRKFLQSGMYFKDHPDKQELTELMIELLTGTRDYWKNRLIIEPNANKEARDRWQFYVDSVTFYLDYVIPNIELLELKPGEENIAEKVKSIKASISAKRGQLTKLQKDLQYYQINASCLTCNSTDNVQQERHDPKKTFCGTLCQNKFYNSL